MTSHKPFVAANFSAAARSYDGWADVQKRAASDLLEALPANCKPHRILDVGCGTGLLTRMLASAYPAAAITGLDLAPAMVEACRLQWPLDSGHRFVCADAEHYASDHLFDLIASNFAFQWFEDKNRAIAHLTRQFSIHGVFALSVPVAGTLTELDSAHQSAFARPFAGLTYPDPETYISATRHAGLQVVASRVTPHVIKYPSALTALKSFKEIGAVFAGGKGRKPMSPAQIMRLTRTYEDLYRTGDTVPVTYQVLTLIASI